MRVRRAEIDRVYHINVEVGVSLCVVANVEIARRIRAERSVQRIAVEGGQAVLAEARRDVPHQAVGQFAPHADDAEDVADGRAELRREAFRKRLDERETALVGQHRLTEGQQVGGGGIDVAVLRRTALARDQELVGAGLVDTVAVHRAAEEKRRRYLAAGVIAEGVELVAVAQVDADVRHGPDAVVDGRRSPRLGGYGDVGNAQADQRGGVAVLDAAVGGRGLAVFEAQVGETVIRQRQPEIGGNGGHVLAGIFRVRAVPGLQGDAFVCVLEDKIQYAGDGVGAVLGRRTVAQHLHALQGNGGNGRNVRSLGAVGGAVGDPLDHRSPVPALVVHEHQRVVGSQPAQVDRAQQRRQIP